MAVPEGSREGSTGPAHQVALTAGLDLAVGDAVIVLDADLQDPPEVILELAARWRDGYDVVYAATGAAMVGSSLRAGSSPRGR